MVTIRNERVSDVGAREALLDTAYGDVRFTKPSHKLRDSRCLQPVCHWSRSRRAASLARSGCGTSAPARRTMHCCWVRWQSTQAAASAASALL